MTTTLQLALRAFPRRWRAVHAEEFLATAAQLRADGLAPMPLLVLAGTVVAGVGVRLRTRPPLRHRLAFRLFNKPVPVAWHDWLRDDLASSWVGVRFSLYAFGPVMAVMVWEILTVDYGLSYLPAVLIFYAVIIVATARFKSRQIRRRVYKAVGWRADGTFPPPPDPGDRRG